MTSQSIEEVDTDVSESETATQPPSRRRKRKATWKLDEEISNEQFLAAMKDSKFSLVRAIRGPTFRNPVFKLLAPFTETL